MRRIAQIAGSLAIFGALAVVPSGPAQASTPSVLQPPAISLLRSGSTFTATPGVWSNAKKVIRSWLIDGKVVPGASKLSFTSHSKKKSVIQFREISGGITALSNINRVGSVAINGFIHINFTDSLKTKLRAILPTTFPARAKVSFQWLNGPFEIRGATLPTYQLNTGNQGTDISLKITYSSKGLSNASSESDPLSIPITPRQYSLVWSEDFTANSTLNPKVWAPQNGDGTAYGIRGWGNQEREWYSQSQANIGASNGLVVSASRNGAEAFKCYYGTNCEWISSKLTTKGLVGFKYGHIEARIKGPVGAGTWGAFWMLGANIDDRPWPGCGEIDIAELIGRDPTSVYGTPHGPASSDSNTVAVPAGFAKEYHIYAIDWLPDQIIWYLDGKPYGTLNESSLSDPTHTWVFDHEFYLIINLAMGGTFSGPVDPSLQSAAMAVDYVHFSTINGVGQIIQH